MRAGTIGRTGSRLKRKLKRYGVAVLLGLLVLVLIVLTTGLLEYQPINRATAVPDGPPFEYKGALHVHTNLSDGRESPQHVALVADRLGLDFLVITDHSAGGDTPLERRGVEGRVGSCIILVGSEVSTEDGHVLSLGTPKTLYLPGGDAAQFLGDVRELGGTSVIAHPVNDRNGWKGPASARADGIEVFNADSAWRNAPAWKLLLGSVTWWVNPSRTSLFVMDDGQRERNQWDAYLEQGPMVGLTGADAHGRIQLAGWNLPFPRYEDSLAWFPVHILTETELSGQFGPDRRMILDAIQRGSCYLSLGSIGPVSGFRFHAVSKSLAQPAGMGQSLTSDETVTLIAELPADKPARIALLSNGAVVAEHWGPRLEYPNASPGVYRVEVYAGEPGSTTGRVPWVLSNPIRVNEPGRPPAPPPIPNCEAGVNLADYEAENNDGLHLQVAGDPLTLEATGPVEVAPPGAAGTRKSLTLPFSFPAALIPPPERFWALVDRQHRDLKDARGIYFYVRSDKRFRFRFEIREQDAQGLMGEEYFSRTFLTTPEWRCVNISFEKLRCIAKGRDGKLDPSKISGIYVVADYSVLTLEASGRLWLDEFKTYP